MKRKVRAHVDFRISSLARDVAQRASGKEELQQGLLSVALTACQTAMQLQTLLSVCRATENTFRASCNEQESDLPVKASEALRELAQTVMRSADGSITEALESMIAVAIEAMGEQHPATRSLSNAAMAAGLDPSQIALDKDEEQTGVAMGPRAIPARRGPARYYSTHDIDVVAAVATAPTRRCVDVRLQRDGDKRFLVGFNGASWASFHELACPPEQDDRVLEAVRVRVRRDA